MKIDSSLNVTDKDDMKMMDISVHNSTIGSDYKITTGLYLHPGVIIYFTRAQPIQFANSLVGHWTWYNQTSPTVTISLAHGFTAKQRNMTDIFDPLGLDPSIQTAMKTNSDKEILSLAEMKTGNIRFDSSHFIVTPPNNNGSSCIADEYALSCAPGDWSITPNNDALKLTYYAGSFSKDQGPAGLPLQLPPRNAPNFGATILTFKSVTPERIIATDSHGDTIYFLRDYLAKTILPVNLVGTWKFYTDVIDGTGPAISGKFVFEPGTHELPVSNANFTETPFYQKFANGTSYALSWDDIRRGQWDMGSHILSLYYFGVGTELWLLKVINPNTVELSGNSGNVVHMTRIPAGSG